MKSAIAPKEPFTPRHGKSRCSGTIESWRALRPMVLHQGGTAASAAEACAITPRLEASPEPERPMRSTSASVRRPVWPTPGVSG